LVWENFLKNYKIPTISEVKVENASVYVPYITILLAILLGAMFRKNGSNVRRWKTKRKWTGILLLLLLFLFWPIRWPVEIPFVKQNSFDVSESRLIFSSLLKNTYRAFDFRSEGDVYDKLATSSEGNLLSEIYIQTKKSMVLENQGGLQVKLKDVVVVDAELVEKEEDGLVFRTRWIVEGDVGHWGHIHKRTNSYDAFIKIRSVDGIWKMYDLEIVEEARII
jgi:hypothetical protein